MINDATRAAFQLVVANALSLAILLGVKLEPEQVAGINSLVSTSLIFLMLVVKKGSAGDPSVTAKVSSTTVTTTTPPEVKP